jgi:hypothetical protein
MRHEAQLAASRTFPWKQAEARENLLLPESLAGQAAHRMSLAFGAKGVRVDAALVRELTRGHQGQLSRTHRAEDK